MANNSGVENNPTQETSVPRYPNVRAASKDFIENLHEEEIITVGQSCLICFEDLDISMYATKLPCGHLFHKTCIEKWLVMKNNCPLCRHEFPAEGDKDVNTLNPLERLHLQLFRALANDL